MTGELYRVNPGDQTQAARDVDTAWNAISDQLSTINGAAESLINQWDPGTAARIQYEERQRNWQKAADEMQNSLQDFKTSLTKVAGISSDTEGLACKTVGS